MTQSQHRKLESLLSKLECLQSELLSSRKHKHSIAIEDLERAKTAIIQASRRDDA